MASKRNYELHNMKVVILAGGFGTRLSEESSIRPKPMAEIGGKPILWHIMKIFSYYGFKDFVILCGYKSHVIKEFFSNYALNNADVTFDLANHNFQIHKNGAEDWKVTLVETGEDTMTGGRLKRAQRYIGDQTFFLTYGDGVADVDMNKLLKFHKKHKALATVTAIEHPGRFGVINLDKRQARVYQFREKAEGENGAYINGGFFVLEPAVFKYIEGDKTVWERESMRRLAKEGKLVAFRHLGFWQCMDTLRDKMVLENLWQKNEAPWKVWR